MTDTKTILVVDDDQEFCKGLQAVLEQHGYRTLGAADGRQARRLIDSRRPDLVILDLLMPLCGGLAVLEHYQEQEGAPPFIMMTANPDDFYKSHAAQAGVVDYICKPFPLERLLAGVERVLGDPEGADEAAAAVPIRFRCPGCGARIKAPAQLLGQTRPCPHCRRPLVVRQEPPDEEPDTGGGNA
jgi:DNA-binding response OmpR family regulator